MKATLTIAALAIASLSVGAQAQPIYVSSIPQIDVFYADLNLSSPAGAEVMLRRIRFAAASVCGGRPDGREIADATRFRACVAAAVSNAVAEVNAAMVSQFHAGSARGLRASYVSVR